jgi:hypothetical protein
MRAVEVASLEGVAFDLGSGLMARVDWKYLQD